LSNSLSRLSIAAALPERKIDKIKTPPRWGGRRMQGIYTGSALIWSNGEWPTGRIFAAEALLYGRG
jgi:hypothetical protein